MLIILIILFYLKMKDVIFIYMNNKYLMKDVENNEFINKILRTYSGVINFDTNELNFFYRGKLLTNLMNKKIGNLNHKTINIFVTKINKSKKNKMINTNILCSLCHSQAKFKLEEEDKISLYDCKQKHKISGLTIKEFIENQKIEEKIRCDICGISKIDCSEDFSISSENKIICQLCSYRLSKELMIKYNSFFNKCKTISMNIFLIVTHVKKIYAKYVKKCIQSIKYYYLKKYFQKLKLNLFYLKLNKIRKI